ncbi:MAG: outer membrane protein assembly factor BamD [Gammaproteobacteria bacterium]|nr:MAG: outer membrane protein assembly factor BamD [Gammaproteobacteria bacterium]
MRRLFWSLLLALLLGGCSSIFGEKDETKGWSQQKLYNEASSELAAGGYEKAIEYYEKLEARYPFGKYAHQAQLDVAYAYYKADEPESALAAADRFIKFHPGHPAVAYAYYLKGLVNFNRSLGFLSRYLPTDLSQRDAGAAVDSYKDFERVVQQFPDSEYAEDARKRMLYLRNNLARHEVHVARYYIKRGAFVAAADRANYVVENYQRTPAVKNALEIMIEAYTRLGLDDLAADAQRVLAANLDSGAIIPDPRDLEEKGWTRRLWDYFGLDKN